MQSEKVMYAPNPCLSMEFLHPNDIVVLNVISLFPSDKGQGVFKVLSQGVIACICVGAILLISFIVGCVVYWRMNKNPPHRPFWTVELKDDHEGVNFNTVPNDDFQVRERKGERECVCVVSVSVCVW